MRRRPLRVALVLAVIAAFGAAGYQTLLADRRIAAELDAVRAFDGWTRVLSGKLGELRSGQQAYVATGQGDSFWFLRVDALLQAIEKDLAALRPAARSPRTTAALEAAARTVDSFEQMDARARDYATHSQQLLASDLIFTDGHELVRTIGAHVDEARLAQQLQADETISAARTLQARMLAAAGAIAFLALLLLAPVSAAARVEEQQPAAEPARVVPRVEPARTVEPVPPPAQAAPLSPPAVTQEGAGIATLRLMADLCTDFGRVRDAGELNGLLERAARLLDAQGIIVWVGDPAGGPLRPMLAHGYPPHTLTKMKSLRRDEDNATSSAYRQSRLEIVRTDGASNGAIAAPLLTAGGCIGVMAAEVRNGAECRPSLQALAGIIAAQIAPLVSVGPAEPAAQPAELGRASQA
jgi:hypothetical protein